MRALIITDQPLVAIGLKNAIASHLSVKHVAVGSANSMNEPEALHGASYGLVLLDLDARCRDRFSALGVWAAEGKVRDCG